MSSCGCSNHSDDPAVRIHRVAELMAEQHRKMPKSSPNVFNLAGVELRDGDYGTPANPNEAVDMRHGDEGDK